MRWVALSTVTTTSAPACPTVPSRQAAHAPRPAAARRSALQRPTMKLPPWLAPYLPSLAPIRKGSVKVFPLSCKFRRESARTRTMPGHMLRQSLARSLLVLMLAAPAAAQDKGTLNPQPLPPLAHPDDPKTAAKELFGRKTQPTRSAAHVYGFYPPRCLAGAEELPINGPTWQVVRLSRNRNWGHPSLVKFLERLSAKAAKKGWPGLLVGDMAQPRGGPMITGHASHQIGLDADIWLTPMPDRTLTRAEREELSATMVVAHTRLDVDPKVWTPGHFEVIKGAAQDPEVERVFVNAAIKKALCRGAGHDREWLSKVRPWWGHD